MSRSICNSSAELLWLLNQLRQGLHQMPNKSQHLFDGASYFIMWQRILREVANRGLWTTCKYNHGNVRGDDSALYHGLRFYLSRFTAIHTDNMWYLTRVINSDYTCTREVVWANT